MIRQANVDDVPTILKFVRELAEYERSLEQVQATEDDLRRDMFGANPAVFAHIAEDEKGEPVGFALWFVNYSTWTGRHGLYLEDLYVTPQARGGGYGKELFRGLARIAVERGYGRFELACLNWNTPSIDFYVALGAERQDEWGVYRWTGETLRRVAE